MTDQERLRVAWNCWWIPASVGVACTAFFIVTNHLIFAIIGLVCVPIGAVLFAVGLVMIGVATAGPRRLLVVMLLSNFPLAYACAQAAIYGSRILGAEVFVVNRSATTTIDSAVVTYNDAVGRSFGRIRPGGRSRIEVRMSSGERADMILHIHRGSEVQQYVLGDFDMDDLIGGYRITVAVSDEAIRHVPE